MDRRAAIAAVRLAFAALACLAIAAEYLDRAIAGGLNPVNFLSSFTMQSSLIAAIVLATAAANWRRGGGASVDLLRGAATVYVAVAALVLPLLFGPAVDPAIPWVEVVLRGVLPAAVIADWLLVPPLTRISSRQSITWFAYPVIWVSFTMLRGPAVDWYPFPELDPAGGDGMVAAAVAAILASSFALCLVVSALSRRRRWRFSAD
jgi:hypothetical protein